MSADTDTIAGLAGVVVSLGAGSDRFTAQGTDDLGGAYDADDKLVVYGGGGADFVKGGSGQDELHGGDDNDTLTGYSGDD